jgi:hypothetical protein
MRSKLCVLGVLCGETGLDGATTLHRETIHRRLWWKKVLTTKHRREG